MGGEIHASHAFMITVWMLAAMLVARFCEIDQVVGADLHCVDSVE
jgi:hypothetical protein